MQPQKVMCCTPADLFDCAGTREAERNGVCAVFIWKSGGRPGAEECGAGEMTVRWGNSKSYEHVYIKLTDLFRPRYAMLCYAMQELSSIQICTDYNMTSRCSYQCGLMAVGPPQALVLPSAQSSPPCPDRGVPNHSER